MSLLGNDDGPPLLLLTDSEDDDQVLRDHSRNSNRLTIDPTYMISLPERPAYSQQAFENKYRFVTKEQDKKTVKDLCPSKNDCKLKPSKDCVWDVLKARVPLLDWARYYSFRENFLSDAVAGFTVGVMQIPQGMAYAMLGNVSPVLGLYVSFFPVLIYFFLGTSHHVSVGTFAIICLMLGKIVHKYEYAPEYEEQYGDGNSNSTSNSTLIPSLYNATTSTVVLSTTIATSGGEVGYDPVQIATAVCLVSGVILVLMSIFRLGSLSGLLSETLISGFTTGAGFQVFTSQVKYLFGVKVKVKSHYLSFVYTYIEIFKQIEKSNWITIVMSILAIATLFLVGECINRRYKAKMKMPVPTELILIIITTTVSYLIDLRATHGVDTVGPIPTGLPKPRVPSPDLILTVALDSVALSIIAFTISLSMGMIFAKKHKYEINPNQELFALGTANVFSSFFSCFPCCVSLSRSLVQEASGGKTQVASLISCVLVLIVVMLMGPLFESLPTCILAAIIIVALKGMFLQLKDFKQAWKVSPLEGIVWLVSFLSVLVADVDIGLGIGVLFSLSTVLFRTLNCRIGKLKFTAPHTCLLGRVGETDIYVELKKYKQAQEISGVKIYRFTGPLHFANKNFFKSNLFELVEVNPRTVNDTLEKKTTRFKSRDSRLRELRRELDKRHQANALSTSKIVNFNDEMSDTDNDSDSDAILPRTRSVLTSLTKLQHVIIDCSAITNLDASGLQAMMQVVQEFEDVNVSVSLAACQVPVLELLKKTKFIEHVPGCCIFPTIHDAVVICTNQEDGDGTSTRTSSENDL